ncbi:MAG: hypothetical protein GX434_13440 [Peptococcaceae bacterium]|nr:hypothetical protein [Peptococcaceae bacterium]
MKKIVLLLFLCIPLFLPACSPGKTDSYPSGDPLKSSFEESQEVEKINDVYIPDHPLTMEETIQQLIFD